MVIKGLTKKDEEYKQRLGENKGNFLDLAKSPKYGEQSNAFKKLLDKGFVKELVEFLERVDYKTIPLRYHQSTRDFPLRQKRALLSAMKKEPVFYHRHIPVYSLNFKREWGISLLGYCYNGRIFIDESIPEKFRDIIAEHELGEAIGGHSIGQVMELVYAEKKGKRRDFLAYCSDTERKTDMGFESWNLYDLYEKLKLKGSSGKRKKDIFNKFLRELREEIKKKKNMPQLLEYEPK